MEKGKLVPNWTIKPLGGGEPVALWTFRQKSHVIVVMDPALKEDQVQKWQAEIQAKQKQWDWLNAKFFFVSELPKDVEPGVYVVDRYARLWNEYPLASWSFEKLDEDLVYYEARHC
jgi:hypothetical protein